METIKHVLINYGHHITIILWVIFLGLLPIWDTLKGKIILVLIGITIVLTMYFGISLQL